MLRIVNLEEIQGLLLQVPELVDKLDRHDLDSVQGLRDWLQDVERVFGNNRMAVVAEVAALRAVLRSVEDGAIPPGYSFRRRLSARKIAESVASDILRQGSSLISQAIQADTARVGEAEQLMRQLVALANYKGLVPDPTDVGDWTGYLMSVWRAMSADQEVRPGTVRLLGLVGVNDALILLDRSITADLVTAPGLAGLS